MLLQLLFLIILLALLFFLSQKISTSIYSIFFLLTKNRGVAIAVLLFLFLPGTIIHELSHFFMATLVRVPTGELTVIPTVDKESGEVRAGRLEIAKTDLVRHTLIGLAPMIVGLILIYLIGNLLTTYHLPASPAGGQLTTILGFYLFFIISSTMFSSKKDLESAVITIPLLILLSSTLYLVGIRLSLSSQLMVTIEHILVQLNMHLLETILLNLIITIFFSFNLSVWKKILKN